MARTMCVWYPDWPLRRPDAPPDEPCLVIDAAGLVIAADRSARLAGVVGGMRRRQAEALCPTAVTLFADPGAEAVAFEPVVVLIESLIPRVEVVYPGLLFIPIAGAVKYYGGEGALVARVEEELERLGVPGGRIGVADGPFAARLAAERADAAPLIVADTAAFISGVDVSAVGVDELVATFRWLGIETLGDLARLPREAVASRFGRMGIAAHRVASGQDRSVMPRSLPEGFSVEERFDPPLLSLDQGAFAARHLAASLLAGLGGGVLRVEVEATSAEGEERLRVWRSPHPFSESELAERIRWQLHAWIESKGIRGGISRLRIVPGYISDEGRQLRFDEDVGSQEDARRALIRAQALVGSDAVLRAVPREGRDPAERVAWYRWGEEAPPSGPDAPWPGAVPGPAPALAARRRPITVEWESGFPTRIRLGSRWEEILSWAGPWRRTGRWWDGEKAVDRYQLVTSAGAFLCEVEGEQAFITGVYD